MVEWVLNNKSDISMSDMLDKYSKKWILIKKLQDCQKENLQAKWCFPLSKSYYIDETGKNLANIIWNVVTKKYK